MTDAGGDWSRHDFGWDRAYRGPALLLGITPGRAYVEVGPGGVRVRFGVWRLQTPLANVDRGEVTGDYAFLKTAGPPHVSLGDRGVTFATNGRRGLCLAFRDPVRVLDPLGLLRHPGATMTVADPEALLGEVERLQAG